MRSGLTDITLVGDRSGSMEEVREDAVNAFSGQQVLQSFFNNQLRWPQ